MVEGAFIRMVTHSGGGTTEFVSDARIEGRTGGFKVSYSLDGDECVLVVDGDTLIQTRRGSLNMHAVFRAGMPSVMEVSSSEGSFELPVATSALNRHRTSRGIYILLAYELAGEKFRLTISIALPA